MNSVQDALEVASSLPEKGSPGRRRCPTRRPRWAWSLSRPTCRPGAIELAFAATEEFTNPAGNVLGGFQAAMLYDTVGPALSATLAPDQFQSTLQLSVSFLRPVRPGRITGKGRVVHRDGDPVFLEASLSDFHGEVVATATARVIELRHARSAA